jgi:membrane fusion protein (multidrug efflux system)
VIENKDHILRPGMMLKISVQLDDREVIKIPEKTLSSIGEKHFVFLLCENNRVKKHYVTVGERGHGFIEIEKGLKPGDKIIAEGNGRLSDEDSVNVVKEETLQLIGGKTAAKLPSSDKRGERR